LSKTFCSGNARWLGVVGRSSDVPLMEFRPINHYNISMRAAPPKAGLHPSALPRRRGQNAAAAASCRRQYIIYGRFIDHLLECDWLMMVVLRDPIELTWPGEVTKVRWPGKPCSSKQLMLIRQYAVSTHRSFTPCHIFPIQVEKLLYIQVCRLTSQQTANVRPTIL